MGINKRQTGKDAASISGKLLRNRSTSKPIRKVAASNLSQTPSRRNASMNADSLGDTLVAIMSAVIAGLILYFVFGIGKYGQRKQALKSGPIAISNQNPNAQIKMVGGGIYGFERVFENQGKIETENVEIRN